jgi:hypothetical protein
MEPGCMGKSNTNNLPVPSDLNESPYKKKKKLFKAANQKLATSVHFRIVIECTDEQHGRFLKNVFIFEIKGEC